MVLPLNITVTTAMLVCIVMALENIFKCPVIEYVSLAWTFWRSHPLVEGICIKQGFIL